jgi:hypothetical protein
MFSGVASSGFRCVCNASRQEQVFSVRLFQWRKKKMARAPQGARPEVEDIPRVSLWLKRKKGHIYFSIGFFG